MPGRAEYFAYIMRRISRVGPGRALGVAIIASLLAPWQTIAGQSTPHRAILVSFDGFSEPWLRAYSDRASAPALWRMFDTGVCADAERPAMPSVTPTSHASIWTGAYANVNGVSASSNGALPWPEKTILDVTDGYSPRALRAEPIWISAARQGVTVWSHMATQSPQPPAYTPVDRSTPALDSARASAAAGIARPNVAAVNTYNELLAPARMIRSASELTWRLGSTRDSLRATIRDDSTVEVHLVRDPARSVLVHLAAPDTTSPRGRELARYFSKPLRIDLDGWRRTFVYFRLWDLSRDHTRVALFVSEARVVQANHAAIAESYDAAVQGVPGNGATKLLENGELGPRALDGGTGEAEDRYFETAELVSRQFLRGMVWGWDTYHPQLSTDYLPYPDEILHQYLGVAEPGAPGVSAAARANAVRMLKRAYVLVDLHLAELERLAAGAPGTRLFVTGEHGMRATWLSFRPNALLAHAGLLTLDAAGKVDLSRTKAAWTPGAWVAVNRVARKGGIVPPDSESAVLARAEQALLSARDAAGRRIVTRVFRPGTAEGDSLGIGGAGGGDLYVDVQPGYYWSAALGTAPVVAMHYPMGEHGFASIDRDMQPALCVLGGGAARRMGVVRTIDIAPTVSAWLGIAPPREATGRPLPIR